MCSPNRYYPTIFPGRYICSSNSAKCLAGWQRVPTYGLYDSGIEPMALRTVSEHSTTHTCPGLVKLLYFVYSRNLIHLLLIFRSF